MRALRIHEAAAHEAMEAATWYESQRPGLGRAFHLALQAAFDLLSEGAAPLVPMHGAHADVDTMRLMLKRFPYDVVVLIQPSTSYVIAVAHHARRPGYWRARLRS